MTTSLWKTIGVGMVGLEAAVFLASVHLAIASCAKQVDTSSVAETLPSQTPQQGSADLSANAKINKSILHLLDKLRADGITEYNKANANFEDYSNQFIKIDNDGNIQSYIKVTEITPAIYQTLSKYGVHVELANEQLKIIQAEVPFYRVKDLAVADFVTRIDPPSYGRTRGPLSTGGGPP